MDDLPARLASDHRAAFADLVTMHQDLVFGVGLRVTRDRSTAEDIAQETFVNAFRALGGYRAERIAALRLRPWLARIALNLARNELRRKRPPATDDGLPDRPAPAAQEPLNLVERREAKDMWARLLAGLPERYRVAVSLRHIEGLSYMELAEATGRPLGSAKSDVHRGVSLLRAAYDAEQRLAAQKEAV